MTISYNRLWKLLIDRKIKQKDLCEASKISHVVLTRMTDGDTVIASVAKEWFTLGDAYEISFGSGVDEIAACGAGDRCLH